MPSAKEFPTLFLLGLSIAVAMLYFRMVQSLVLPLLLACVAAVLFFPLFRWVEWACFNRARIAAAISTALIVTVVLVPIGGGLTLAGMQLVKAANTAANGVDLQEAKALLDSPNGDGPLWLRELRSRFTKEEIEQARRWITNGLSTAITSTSEKTTSIVADVVSFFVGLGIFLIALYYFLAENKEILRAIEHFSPLDEEDDRALWRHFVEVCRGVLLGDVFAALLQAVLCGLAFAVLGVEQALLLGFLTFFLALTPFVGAPAAWVLVAIGLAWSGEYGKAIGLVVYGVLIVGTVDNLIRAHILHHHGRLHPLVALVSIVGALQFVGLWGIVVGPVVAAFFYALLEILNKKMRPEEPHLQLPE